MNRLSPTQLAYLAAILDGEGEFSVNRYARKDERKRLRNYGLKVTVRISQARRSLLDSIAKDVGPHNVNIGRTGRNLAYFYLRFNHAYLLWLIPRLIPYLRLKTEQASIVLQFLQMPRHVGRKGVGNAEWQRRFRLYTKCCRLNTTPQALAKHKKNGTKPHYMLKTAEKPLFSAQAGGPQRVTS